MSLQIDFSTLAGVAAVNVFVTESIVKECKITKAWAKQLISWVTPLLLSVVGLLCQFGLFADYGPLNDWHAWLYTVLTGVGVGLVSNGLYDIPFIQSILNWIRNLFHKKEKLSPSTEDFSVTEDEITGVSLYKNRSKESPTSNVDVLEDKVELFESKTDEQPIKKTVKRTQHKKTEKK